MVSDIAYLIAGLTVLYFGAEFLVKGAKNLALGMGIRPMIVGLTVVAFGTSMPEFFVSFSSALKGASSIAVGNILFVIGLTAMISPIPVEREVIFLQTPVMLAFSIVLLPFMILNRDINRFEGFCLLAGYAIYIVWIFL